MKVLPFEIPKPTKDALIYQEDHELVFYDKLHQHQEIQLSYLVEGEGTLVVGDTVNQYKKGDVLVIGSNLPHVFKSEVNANKKSLMLTLFFTREGFGKHFFDLEELHSLSSFFRHAENGFKVHSDTETIGALFTNLKRVGKLKRFTTFLEILSLLTKAKKTELSSFVYEKKFSANEGKRMQDVISYTMNHYQKQINLEEVAYVANMTKNAFCKYFKKRTNKTYFRFLNELRVENASKVLLSNSDLSIAEIADKSGFNNISNFNRQFKSVKGMVPSEYRKTKAI